MKKSVLFVVFGFILIFGMSLILAEDNSTNNETGDDFECFLDSDCNGNDICINGECEDVEEDENETEIEAEDNETEVDFEYEEEYENGTKIKYKEKRGIGQTIRGQVKAGVYTAPNGETFRVRDLAQNRMLLSFGDGEDTVEVETELEVEEETTNGTTKLKIKLKNGETKEVRVMPNAASEKALERLRLKTCSEENNCTIELKELGEGNNSKVAYEIQIERHSRILGIFKSKMKIETQIDAENGEVLKVKKPWWAFIAFEPAEE